MSAVSTFYTSVINEVIENLKTQFNDDGIDAAALNDLKELWEKKIKESGALEPTKLAHIQPGHQFTAMMQQNGAQGGVSNRMTSVNNAGSRLIKPSGQGTLINDQNFTTTRMAMPMFQMQTVPMVLNSNQQQGVALFSQYHNIVQQQNNSAHLAPDNGIVNLRKNQNDGVDDNSSDEEGGDFLNVSEVDPMSVRAPMSNLFRCKKEEKVDDSDEELVEHDIDVLNSSSVHPLHDSDEDEEVNEDEAEDEANEEAPLNSEDDISDDDPDKIFDSENVIVCQYDKVSRTRNKWKLNFVSGIANFYGKDTVFHKAVGEAEW